MTEPRLSGIHLHNKIWDMGFRKKCVDIRLYAISCEHISFKFKFKLDLGEDVTCAFRSGIRVLVSRIEQRDHMAFQEPSFPDVFQPQ